MEAKQAASRQVNLDLKCVLRYVKLVQQDAVIQAGIGDIELIAGDVIIVMKQNHKLSGMFLTIMTLLFSSLPTS